jgi:hypothetical protein
MMAAKSGLDGGVHWLPSLLKCALLAPFGSRGVRVLHPYAAPSRLKLRRQQGSFGIVLARDVRNIQSANPHRRKKTAALALRGGLIGSRHISLGREIRTTTPSDPPLASGPVLGRTDDEKTTDGLFALCWRVRSAVPAMARRPSLCTAYAMHGEPALPADYAHLPYVNPDAPKGGSVTYGVVGTFDSVSPFIIKSMRTHARGVIDPRVRQPCL